MKEENMPTLVGNYFSSSLMLSPYDLTTSVSAFRVRRTMSLRLRHSAWLESKSSTIAVL